MRAKKEFQHLKEKVKKTKILTYNIYQKRQRKFLLN